MNSTIQGKSAKNLKRFGSLLAQIMVLLLLMPSQALGQGVRQWGGETLTPLGGAEYQSAKFGRVSMTGNPSTSNLAWVPGMGSFLDARGSGLWNSPEYGDVQRANSNAGWVTSSRFGWTHFAPNAGTYGGWTWTERFQWMKFDRPGNAVYLWVPMMRSWMEVNPDGTFHSFEWGRLTPHGLNRYDSSIFGGLTSGNFGGWVHSDRFDWMWANGDSTWFWSQGRQEWLGITAGGGIWSTKEARFLLRTVSQFEDMAKIPAGWFTMGRTSGDTESNAPPVNVYVSEFYMARYEVTWDLWDAVRTWAVQNGYTDISTGGGKGANHPVHSVSWWDAVKWCNARSEREGLTPVYRNANATVFKTGAIVPTANWNANGYRLPTEAEWEKAARGGVSGRRFPWGDTISHSQANYQSSTGYSYDISPTRAYHPTYAIGEHPYTSPVGSFGANGYGLYNMSGNVFEWCWDWYADSSYTDGASDPKGDSSGTDRVTRGGSWYSYAWYGRSARRYWNSPGGQNYNFGFRPARRKGVSP